MKHKITLTIAKRVCDALCIGCIALLVILLFVPHMLKRAVGILLLVLLCLLAIWNLSFLRCPHCGAHMERFGNRYCRRCGANLQDEQN